MSYTSGFFDAVDLGGGEYDREYSAATFAHYFSLLVKNGVFPDPSTGMQVKASSNPDMHVSIQPGNGWVNGYYITVSDNAPEILTVPTANPSLSRIDSVIMGLNYVEREIQLYIKSGAVSSSPSAVSLQRDNDLYEMELAQITVAAGVASISQANITDMRQNTSRCGIVKGTIDQIDTTDLFAQYNDAFQTWFADIQAQLSGDVATNLQNQINNLSLSETTKDIYGEDTPDSIFQLLSIVPNGKARAVFEFKTRLGIPIDHAVLMLNDGTIAWSDEKGLASIDVPPGSTTVQITAPIGYTLEATSQVVSLSAGSWKKFLVIGSESTQTSLDIVSSTPCLGVSKRVKNLQVFMSGGGGSGAAVSGKRTSGSYGAACAGGGGGGYTTSFTVDTSDGAILKDLLIGAGGAAVSANTSSSPGKEGGSSKMTFLVPSSLGTKTVLGGKGGTGAYSNNGCSGKGGDGGSGGGSAFYQDTGRGSASAGGTDGSDGATSADYQGSLKGGKGQGTSTKPFGTKPAIASGGGGACVSFLQGNIKHGIGANNNSGVASLSGAVTGTTPSAKGCGGGGAVGASASTAYPATSGKGSDGVIMFQWSY